ncbi:metalloprotease [Gurleya vavrai]
MNFQFLLSLINNLQINLPNNLNGYYLINKDAKKSSIAISVKAGILQSKLPGTSELIKKMFYKRNQSLSIDSDFKSFLTRNNGNTEIQIHDDMTIFYFDIESKFFEKAMEIFSNLFKMSNFDKTQFSESVDLINKKSGIDEFDDILKVKKFLFSCKKVLNKYDYIDFSKYNSEELSNIIEDHWNTFFYSENMRIFVYHNDKGLESKIDQFFRSIPEKKICHLNLNSIDYSYLKNDSSNSKTLQNNMNSNYTITTHQDSFNIYCLNLYKESLEHQKYNNDPYNLFFIPQENNISGKTVLNRIDTHSTTLCTELFGKIFYLKPSNKFDKLVIIINLPEISFYYQKKYIDFFKFIFFHYHEYNLEKKLRLKNFSCRFSMVDDINEFNSILRITFYLTKNGADNIESVLETIFCHINNLNFNENDYVEFKKTNFKTDDSNIITEKIVIEASKLLNNLLQSIDISLIYDFYNEYSGKEIEIFINFIKDIKNWVVIVLNNKIFDSYQKEKFEKFYGKNYKPKNGKLNENSIGSAMSLLKVQFLPKHTKNINDLFSTSFSKNINQEDLNLHYIYNNYYNTKKSYISIFLYYKFNNNNLSSMMVYLNLVKKTLYECEFVLINKYEIRIDYEFQNDGVEILINGYNGQFSTVIGKFFDIYQKPEQKFYNCVVKSIIYDLKDTKANSYKAKIFEYLKSAILETDCMDNLLDSLKKLNSFNDLKISKIDKIKFFVCTTDDFLIFKDLAESINDKCSAKIPIEPKKLVINDIKFLHIPDLKNMMLVNIDFALKSDLNMVAKQILQKELINILFNNEINNFEIDKSGFINNLETIQDYDLIIYFLISDESVRKLDPKFSDLINLYNKKLSKLEDNTFKEICFNASDNYKFCNKNLFEYFNFYKKLSFAGIYDQNYIENICDKIMNLNVEDLKMDDKKVILFKKFGF